MLPAYGNYGNPLDVTAGFSPDSLPLVVKTLIDDPNVGMLFISFPISYAAVVKAFNKGMADSPKPKVMVALGDTWQLAPDIMQAVGESPAVFSRSSDRMLRAITLYTRYGRLLAPRRRVRARPSRSPGLPKLGKGTQPEWLGKKVLAAAGIRVPEGELARTADERGRGRKARRLSGGLEGAGRGAVAQDRSRRRDAEPRRRGGAARRVGHDDDKRQARRARCDARRRAWSRDVAARASS